MSRYPPVSTKALTPIILYGIRKETGSVGSTIIVNRIKRDVVVFENHAGQFVRYERNFHRLHPAAEFQGFLEDHVKSVTDIVLYHPQLHHFEPGNVESPLPFLIAWEPEFMY